MAQHASGEMDDQIQRIVNHRRVHAFLVQSFSFLYSGTWIAFDRFKTNHGVVTELSLGSILLRRVAQKTTPGTIQEIVISTVAFKFR